MRTPITVQHSTTEGNIIIFYDNIESMRWPEPEHLDVCMLRTTSGREYEICYTKQQFFDFIARIRELIIEKREGKIQ